MPWQVASFIVHCRAGRAPALARSLRATPGLEVPWAEGERLIVLVEAENEEAFARRLAALQDRPEVLLANLAFHQIDFDEE